jgi:hypothetical protein
MRNTSATTCNKTAPGIWWEGLAFQGVIRCDKKRLVCGCGIAGRWKGGRKKKVASDSDNEGEAAEEEQESDVLVPDTATAKFAKWSISYRGRWTRWGGRHSLPTATLKAAARR